MKSWIRQLFLVAIAGTFAMTSNAQTFPNRPIKLIVPFAPGGTTDMVARIIGTKLAEVMGQSVIVDNRGGGGTVIGTDALARSPADGYTIMLATPDFTVNPSLLSSLPYDTLKDFSPIALIATYPMVLVSNAEHKLDSVADLLSKARARPGQINFASGGSGSMPHLCAELLNNLAGVNMMHVPYKGNGPAVTDLLAGHVSLLFTGMPPVASHVKSGKLKVLGVSTAKRHSSLPEVQTIAEAGLAGYDVTAWFGFIAPAGVPKEVIARLNADLVKTLQTPEVRDKLASLGAELGAGTSEVFSKLIRDEIERWSRLVRAANIKAS